MARKPVAPMEPPIQVTPFGHIWRWESAVGCVGEVIPLWKLLAIYPGGGFACNSTPLGAAVVDDPEEDGHATSAWGCVVGTHPRQIASRGPQTSPVIAVCKHPHTKFIYPGAQRGFLVT